MSVRKITDYKTAPDKFFDLQDKVCFVTGAASGLGQAIALTFDALGAKVILADINEDGMRDTAAEMKGDIMIVKMDVTDENSVRAAIQAAYEKYGRIDVSCHNPGINIRKEALELSYEEFDRVLEINLKGVFRCCKEVGKIMVEQGSGSIINMASVFGEICMPRQVAYSTTKGGVKMMTKVLAGEWAKHGVRVNCIGPAYVETPLIAQIMADKDWYDKIRRNNPFKRFGLPEEVAAAAVYLASDASSYTTGLFLPVDGGWIWYGGDVSDD